MTCTRRLTKGEHALVVAELTHRIEKLTKERDVLKAALARAPDPPRAPVSDYGEWH